MTEISVATLFVVALVVVLTLGLLIVRRSLVPQGAQIEAARRPPFRHAARRRDRHPCGLWRVPHTRPVPRNGDGPRCAATLRLRIANTISVALR